MGLLGQKVQTSEYEKVLWFQHAHIYVVVGLFLSFPESYSTLSQLMLFNNSINGLSDRHAHVDLSLH